MCVCVVVWGGKLDLPFSLCLIGFLILKAGEGPRGSAVCVFLTFGANQPAIDIYLGRR